VPAERIAENLAFINWTVLTGLAFGSFAAVVLARLRTVATRGFLAFTAACAAGTSSSSPSSSSCSWQNWRGVGDTSQRQ